VLNFWDRFHPRNFPITGLATFHGILALLTGGHKRCQGRAMKTTDRLREAGDGKQIKPRSNEVVGATRMYETENDLPKAARTELNALINQRLADAVDLQMQLKQAHWNVKGPHFIGLHQLFDEISEAVEGYVDLIAERIVQLGGVANGTLRSAAARSRLDEYPESIADGAAHVEAVAKALSTFAREARMSIDEANTLEDADTADMFTEISRGVDKWLWFVEAHTQATK
jgi:starvation-inducible DNA-binding protein